MILFLLLPLVLSYPFSTYNGYYNRFGDFILPGRPEYYPTSQGSSFLPSYYTQGSFSSYSSPSVVTANHGYGGSDYYQGYGNGLPAFGSSDGRLMSYPPRYGSPYPLLSSEISSPYSMDRSFGYPFKKQ